MYVAVILMLEKSRIRLFRGLAQVCRWGILLSLPVLSQTQRVRAIGHEKVPALVVTQFQMD